MRRRGAALDPAAARSAGRRRALASWSPRRARRRAVAATTTARRRPHGAVDAGAERAVPRATARQGRHRARRRRATGDVTVDRPDGQRRRLGRQAVAVLPGRPSTTPPGPSSPTSVDGLRADHPRRVLERRLVRRRPVLQRRDVRRSAGAGRRRRPGHRPRRRRLRAGRRRRPSRSTRRARSSSTAPPGWKCARPTGRARAARRSASMPDAAQLGVPRHARARTPTTSPIWTHPTRRSGVDRPKAGEAAGHNGGSSTRPRAWFISRL